MAVERRLAGILRNAAGAVLATSLLEGSRVHNGFLVNKEGKLVVEGVEGGSSTPTVKTIATSGTAQTLPKASEFGLVDLTLTANCTITVPAAAKGYNQMLWIRQGGGGPWTVTWAGTLKWSYGSSPALTPSAEAVDVVGFTSPDGSAWYGFPAGYEFK